MSKIGYIRVSTEHQETARQQEIMRNYQVDHIFSEKLSGAIADRPQLRAMLDYVREGDTLYVESISRLGRSTKDLLNIVDTLTAKGVTLVSNKENIDTDTPSRQSIAVDWGKFGKLYTEWRSGYITAREFQRRIGLKANTAVSGTETAQI